jgi:hypothetical protein
MGKIKISRNQIPASPAGNTAFHLIVITSSSNKISLATRHVSKMETSKRQVGQKRAEILAGVLSEYVSIAFEIAVVKALKETRLPDSVFPEICPYTIDQITGTVTQ